MKNKNKTPLRIDPCNLWLIYFTMFISYNAFPSGSDSTKYDISDPRNPNCPCHQYQQLANEEYMESKKRQDTSYKLQDSIHKQEAVHNGIAGTAKRSRLPDRVLASLKWKQRRAANFLVKFQREQAMRRKIRTKADDCFSWK